MGAMADAVIKGRNHVAGGTEVFVEDAPAAVVEG
jgi:small subunit ribosomal protein S2